MFYKIFVHFSLLALVSAGLQAKSIEVLLDHSNQETFHFELPPENPSIETSLQCMQLKIENIGQQPIEKCFPSINHPPLINLERLASYLVDEKYPLLALYQLWNRFIVRDDSLSLQESHPFDLLIFIGACPSKSADIQFIKLCRALGIQTRQANIRGRTYYDFSNEENDWNFLDLESGQHYLALDNRRLVSSEEVMDDPFLALRTKHSRKSKDVDFVQTWQQLARFDILEPIAAPEVVFELQDLPSRPEGFSLYPKETLVFDTPETYPTLPDYKRRVEHVIHLEERKIQDQWTYATPIPLQRIENRSTADLYLPDYNVIVKAGEGYTISGDVIFTLSMEFSEQPKGTLALSGTFAPILFPALNAGQNLLHLGAEENPGILQVSVIIDEELEAERQRPAIDVLNQEKVFDFCTPVFELGMASEKPVESMWWQISPQPDFSMIPSNLDQIESYSPTIALTRISETFLSPGNIYYFRVKGCIDGKWSGWSPSYAFRVNKPAHAEEIEFDKVDDNLFEINWERMAEEPSESLEYLVFGSNALDFIPSIYCDKQINGIVDGVVVDEDVNDNLVAITTEPKLLVKGSLAFYRIVARQRGQLSVPSELVHIYDHDLIQPRSVLQMVDGDNHDFIAKRTLLPVSYPATEVALPHVFVESLFESSLMRIQSLLRAATVLEGKPYQCPEGISQEIWESWQKYLLPSNHALKPKLDRIFSAGRITLTPETCRKAGFTRYTPQRWSRVVASPHGDLRGYWCKMYCDNELRVMNCHARWINRIYGAECIRKCIKENNLEKMFNVPNKWLYVLPNRLPKQYKDNAHYVEKYTILVCEDARSVGHSQNKKMYKQISDRRVIKGFYTIIQTCGLWDSVFSFNNPFSKDGRIWFIDCEGHHRWPIHYRKFTRCFSSSMGDYWERCFKEGSIPDGQSYRGLRRTDR